MARHSRVRFERVSPGPSKNSSFQKRQLSINIDEESASRIEKAMAQLCMEL